MKSISYLGYVKNLVDNISIDKKGLTDTSRYVFDGDGTCEVEMQFYDGLAIATDESDLVMKYPKLVDVADDEKMCEKIYKYCRDSQANQYDVAMVFGEVEQYKMVVDYNIWSLGDNADLDITAIYSQDGNFLFDVLDEDYIKMLDDGVVLDWTLIEGLTDKDIKGLQAKYGILWTDKCTREMVYEY